MTSIEQLADRLAIQDTLTRYATALDTKRPELFDEVFTPDAYVDYSASGGIKGTYTELRDWLAEAMSGFSAWQHLLSNFVIKIEGDEAESFTSCYNPLSANTEDGGSAVVHVGANYTDRLRRTPQGWRIYHRTLGMVWMDDPSSKAHPISKGK